MAILTRAEAHALAWSAPMREVAKQFGLSDTGLRKNLSGAGIPLPPQGHWIRQESRRIKLVPLPPRRAGASDLVYVGEGSYYGSYRQPDLPLSAADPLPPVFDEPLDVVRSREAKYLGKVVIERDLANGDPAIRAYLEKDERRRQRQSNYPLWGQINAPHFDSGFERRRLIILNSIALALRRWGDRLSITGTAARDLWALGTPLLLDHPAGKKDRWGREWEVRREARGELMLVVGSDLRAKGARSWRDGETKLEKQLPSILLDLIVLSEERYRAHQFRLHEETLERRAQMRIDAEKAREAAEVRAVEQRCADLKAAEDELLGQASAHRRAQDIRSFVATVRDRPGLSGDELAAWATWALSVADKVDPLVGVVVQDGHLKFG